jgi:hypothetical protein
MIVSEYQIILVEKLKKIFIGNDNIKKEWRADIGQFNLYSPRLDLAVGPFAINKSMIDEYELLQNKYRIFIEGIIEIHNLNLSEIYENYNDRNIFQARKTNYNPRCFIGIEIENSSSRKHLLGGAINASALSRFGLLIGYNEDKYNALRKLEGYLNFLTEVKKNTFNTNNLLILRKDQLITYLDNYISSNLIN